MIGYELQLDVDNLKQKLAERTTKFHELYKEQYDINQEIKEIKKQIKEKLKC
jgi:peptidoglycan hydrolase CwlO-like protein